MGNNFGIRGGLMARQVRKISSTGDYHIILRGINRQDIFFDNQDYYKFIKEMKNTKEKYHYNLYSYVLMPNHVHLEIKDNKNELSKIMHRLLVSYSIYFNKKYERVGHVFQDRFLSKPVENTEYLLNLMRYIHQNPIKAQISKIENYKWSSYREYVYNNGITDTELILEKFDKDFNVALDKFKGYNQKIVDLTNDQDVLEYEIVLKLTDEQLIHIIKHEIGEQNLQNIQYYNKKYRDTILRNILQIRGTSKAQIARVLGINRKLIK